MYSAVLQMKTPYARRWIAVIGAIIFAALHLANPLPVPASPDMDANKAIIQRLYDEALNGRDLDVLDAIYATEYTEHSPSLVGGVAVLKKTFQGNFDQFPEVIWEIKRMAAEDDLVWVHAQINPTGERGNELVGLALIEIYRLQDGQVVEHWEVQQAIPEQTADGHTMF